jgi:putative endonuclease
MTNRPNGIHYVGVTSDLVRRITEHRDGASKASPRNGLKRLVFVEQYEDFDRNPTRENMKHWPRAWKVRLILGQNPNWDDLYDRLF